MTRTAPLTPSDIAARKQQLEKRLGELDTRLHKIADHLDDAPNPDWEENAQESENDEVLEGLGIAGQKEIAAIRAALDRISNGTFGKCVTCGKTISAERLDVVPWTPFCRDHG
jgi:RNA polymerase-binding transcription factor DksA